MVHDLTTQEGRSHYADAMSGRKRQSEFLEIRTDYMDDKGVIHIDGYKSLDDDEEGVGIGYFIHGEVYWRDPEYQFDPLVKAIVAETLSEQKPFILDTIDWKLLKEQKAILVNLNEGNTHYINGTQEDALNGVLALLDNIQDYAVDVLGKPESEVFNLIED